MNLLIVDDDPTSLKLLRAQLEAEGHAVFEAYDGVDALALLERQRMDAVISDILMPRMDGYRLCHEIRKSDRLRDLPIVLYTSSYTSPSDEKLALDLGADKYLMKPASIETIITALHEVIAKPHAAPHPEALGEIEVLKEYSGRLVSTLVGKTTELMAAEVKFRSLVEQSIVGIYIIQDDQFVYVNPRMAEIFGRSEEEMTSRMVYDFVVPEDHALARENIRKRISGGVPSIHYHLRMLHQSGAVLQVEVHSSRADYHGRPAVMGTLLDITERRRAEDELQQTLERLRRAVGTTIQVMASAVEIRDPYTSGHQIRSAGLARAIATEMGLPPEKIEGISMAGSIHDIGKLSIPAEILSKPTKLSEIEFSLIKEHARKGYEMLKDVESPWPLAEIVHQHHERMDGSGYPRNLKGDDILIEARILTVADVVEAMASHRPYRPGLGIDAALNEIEKNRGTLYDGAVADACLRLFREKGFNLEGT